MPTADELEEGGEMFVEALAAILHQHFVSEHPRLTDHHRLAEILRSHIHSSIGTERAPVDAHSHAVRSYASYLATLLDARLGAATSSLQARS